jgi:hypothetical protein
MFQIFGDTSVIFKKKLEEKDCPIGENSPNLVTLFSATRARSKASPTLLSFLPFPRETFLLRQFFFRSKKMKLSRSFIFLTLAAFLLLRLALSAEYQNASDTLSLSESVLSGPLFKNLDLAKIFDEAR